MAFRSANNNLPRIHLDHFASSCVQGADTLKLHAALHRTQNQITMDAYNSGSSPYQVSGIMLWNLVIVLFNFE